MMIELKINSLFLGIIKVGFVTLVPSLDYSLPPNIGTWWLVRRIKVGFACVPSSSSKVEALSIGSAWDVLMDYGTEEIFGASFLLPICDYLGLYPKTYVYKR